MTKMRWDKADHYEPDPGAVVEVPVTTRPLTPPDELKRREAARAAERRALRERSERRDMALYKANVVAMIRRKQARGVPLSGLDRLVLNSADETQ
jgi:hypothetical protein